MNDEKKTVRVVLEIEWTSSGDEKLDVPAMWDWKRIKLPMNVERVKYLGMLSNNYHLQSAESWMGN
jgi:hypothetical protein